MTTQTQTETQTYQQSLESLAARIEKLERALAAKNRANVIETNELRLIDAQGKAKAVLSVDECGPFLTFPDSEGTIQTEVLPLVAWEGPADRVRASLWSLK